MYLPEFKGPIEGYVTNSLKRELWRIARTHTREDAMQEAFIVFMRCAAHYPIVDTPAHFMALFKRAWANALNDLSIKATHAAMLVSENLQAPEAEGTWTADAMGETENAGVLSIMVEQAPREVLMVLNLFLNAPSELLELATAAWAAKGRRKADGNAMLSRLLGTDPDADLVGQVERYFKP